MKRTDRKVFFKYGEAYERGYTFNGAMLFRNYINSQLHGCGWVLRAHDIDRLDTPHETGLFCDNLQTFASFVGSISLFWDRDELYTIAVCWSPSSFGKGAKLKL